MGKTKRCLICGRIWSDPYSKFCQICSKLTGESDANWLERSILVVADRVEIMADRIENLEEQVKRGK